MGIIKRRESILDPDLAKELVAEIVTEIRRPNRSSRPVGAPVIIQEESGGVPRYSHWYVIWDRFADIDTEARSRVIMDAVEERFGKNEVLRTSQVMGLTPEEPLAREVFPEESAQAAVPTTAVRETPARYGTRGTPSRKTKT